MTSYLVMRPDAHINGRPLKKSVGKFIHVLDIGRECDQMVEQCKSGHLLHQDTYHFVERIVMENIRNRNEERQMKMQEHGPGFYERLGRSVEFTQFLRRVAQERFFEAGRNILCEKAIARDKEDAEEILNILWSRAVRE